MSDDRAFLNGHAGPESLPADLAAVEQRLARDGTAWQQEMPATTRLAAYVNSRVPRDVAARLPVIQHKGRHIMDTQADARLRDAHPSRYRRSFPIAAAVLLLLVVGGYFGLQAFHQHPNAGAHPGLASLPPPTPTAIPVRWYSLTDVVYTKVAATPIENFVLGNDFATPEHLHLRSEADPQQIHAGDVLKLVWEINGRSVTGPNCCLYALSVQQNGTDFVVTIPEAGAGTVKLYYNTTLAYTATFTIVGHDTLPPTAPPTPVSLTPTATPVPAVLSPLHCTMSLQSDGPTPTPGPCKKG